MSSNPSIETLPLAVFSLLANVDVATFTESLTKPYRMTKIKELETFEEFFSSPLAQTKPKTSTTTSAGKKTVKKAAATISDNDIALLMPSAGKPKEVKAAKEAVKKPTRKPKV